MLMTKLSIAVALAVALVATAAGVLACQSLAAVEPVPSGADKRAAKKQTGDEVSPATFDKLHRLIKPDPKTSFENVPWLTSLWQARQQAAAEGKPIVLWAGDPLPLGIT